MNNTYRSIWNETTGTFVAASENARSTGKKTSSAASAQGANTSFALQAIAMSVMLSFGAGVHAAPVGGVVATGGATIISAPGFTTINQSTQNAAINWQSFNVGATEAVRFVQPNSNSVTLNRVLGADPSSILGTLSANGKVFLVNPNGILFGQGASVNVSGLVASTLNLTDADFMAGSYKFAGSSGATLVNQGAINADGGYVALLGANVSNAGVISARLGTVALAAGNAVTLDLAGDGLLNITVTQGAVNALVQNGGLLRADGGQVLLSAQSAGSLLQSAVNNTGIIQAQTIESRNGRIMLMGDMQNGTVNVAGKLDASAPNGGDGGFIETSAAHVKVQDTARITTAAAQGRTGTWLIDPVDFIIAAPSVGGDIAGTTLSAQLVTNSVVISTVAGSGNGDIFVNEAIGGSVSWTATPNPTTLTLNAARDVNINAAITATNGSLVVCCGRDINVNAAITTTNGSISLSAGNNINLNRGAALTTTDGNIALCAANDVNVNGAITLTRGSSTSGQRFGLLLSAGSNGTGPGVTGGTVFIDPLSPQITVTKAPATIFYNPVSYTTPTDYLTKFTLTEGATLTQFMLVFPGGADKTFDNTTLATFTSLKGDPAGVTLVAGAGNTATFDTPEVGTGKVITFTGYSLAGANAGNFALPESCCGPVVGKTIANITAAIVVVPPPVVVPPVVVSPGGPPPVVVPPVVVPPVVVPPVVVPPVVVPPPEVVPPVTLAPLELPPVESPPDVAPPVPAPTWMPGVVLAKLPPELVALMPPAPVIVPPVQAPPVVRPPAPLVVPVETPPPVYVAPVRPPKQDRN